MVKVIESAPGVCDVEVRYEQHLAATKLHLPAGSQLFDRARAIAIQARLLMTWQNPPENKAKDVASRPAPRNAVKSEPRPWQVQASSSGGGPPAAPSPSLPKGDSVPNLAARREASPVPASPVPAASTPAPVPSRFASEPSPRPVESAPLDDTATEGRSAPRSAESKPPARIDAKPTTGGETVAASKPDSEPLAEKHASAVRKTASAATAVQATLQPSPPRWPWIPTAIGAGAAVAAGISAALSRGHYNALEDKGQPLASARSEKSAGEKWQTTSLVLAGVAAIAVGTGIVGFATGSSDAGQVRAMATPIPGGGMVALAGSLP
jgi:hypothetical protein